MRLLVICRQPPYSSSLAKEALELALAHAAFGYEVSLLLMDKAVLQLINQQNGEPLGQKTLQKNLAALPIYDIDTIYVDQQALQKFGLEPQNLDYALTALNHSQLSQLCDNYDCIYTF